MSNPIDTLNVLRNIHDMASILMNAVNKLNNRLVEEHLATFSSSDSDSDYRSVTNSPNESPNESRSNSPELERGILPPKLFRQLTIPLPVTYLSDSDHDENPICPSPTPVRVGTYVKVPIERFPE